MNPTSFQQNPKQDDGGPKSAKLKSRVAGNTRSKTKLVELKKPILNLVNVSEKTQPARVVVNDVPSLSNDMKVYATCHRLND